jgi:uncharacterized protein DUF2817
MASFNDTYSQARDEFIAAATRAGGVCETISHPERGPDGGNLSTDVAWLGPRDAGRVLVTLSATHGVEGFAGSGSQIDWLERGEAARLPKGVAALLIHAVNPYGFAWLRRVTHENVDLNRNWIDFSEPPPSNTQYDELAEAICPVEWFGEGRVRGDEALAAYAARHGAAALQKALSGGQYSHPNGIFYGGTTPTWSRRTQERIYAEYLTHATKVAVIDFHTGLGPSGYGERIVTVPRDSAGFKRAARWYGNGLMSPYDGTSTSAPIVGDGLSATVHLLPHAEVTSMALEFGTEPLQFVLEALRADTWLHTHGKVDTPEGRAIKAKIRSAFYCDTPHWQGMIVGQALLACRQAVSGLAEMP